MPNALTRAIAKAGSILLTTPDLDGDAVGAIAALGRAVAVRWPEKRVIVLADEPLPARYAFLVPPDLPFQMADAVPVSPVDLALVIDGDPARFQAVQPHFAAARQRGMVDHHKSSDLGDLDVGLLDPLAASTTELVLRLCDHWGVALDPALAEAIFTGMAFDTSVFRYRLTRPRTLRAAARLLETGIDHAQIVDRVLMSQPVERVRLRGQMIMSMQLAAEGRLAWASLTAAQVDAAETGGLVDDLVFIEGVEIGLLAVERGDGRVKVSLRSRGGIDVSALARRLSPHGGGHARAAGATLRASLDDATERAVVAALAALGPPVNDGAAGV